MRSNTGNVSNNIPNRTRVIACGAIATAFIAAGCGGDKPTYGNTDSMAGAAGKLATGYACKLVSAGGNSVQVKLERTPDAAAVIQKYGPGKTVEMTAPNIELISEADVKRQRSPLDHGLIGGVATKKAIIGIPGFFDGTMHGTKDYSGTYDYSATGISPVDTSTGAAIDVIVHLQARSIFKNPEVETEFYSDSVEPCGAIKFDTHQPTAVIQIMDQYPAVSGASRSGNIATGQSHY